MLIETYEVTEAIADDEASRHEEAEAVAIAERLGLTGQQKLRAAAGTRIAFPKLTAEQDRVLTVLCPARTELTKYEAPIPARVLRLAEAYRDAFTKFEVWAPYDPRAPDPVLVGLRTDPAATWRADRFLVARWGDVLDDWDALRAAATRRLAIAWRHAANVIKAAAGAIPTDSETAVATFLHGVGEEPWYVNAGLHVR